MCSTASAIPSHHMTGGISNRNSIPDTSRGRCKFDILIVSHRSRHDITYKSSIPTINLEKAFECQCHEY